MAPAPGLPGLSAPLSRTPRSWVSHQLCPSWPACPCSQVCLSPAHLPSCLLFGGPLLQPPACCSCVSNSRPMLLPRQQMPFPPLSLRFLPTPDLTLTGEGPHPKRPSLAPHVLASTLCMVFTARTPFRVWMCVILYLCSLSPVGAEILGQEPVCLVDPGPPALRRAPGTSCMEAGVGG